MRYPKEFWLLFLLLDRAVIHIAGRTTWAACWVP